MIKKIYNLTYNEIAKQLKKISIKSIMILILLSAIVAPIGINMINSTALIENTEEGHKYSQNQYQMQIDDMKNDKTEKGKVIRGGLEAERDYWKIQAENKVKFEDWRKREVDEYRSLSYNIFALGQVIDGIDSDTLLSNIQNVNPEEVGKYYEISKDKLKEKLNTLTAERDRILSIIVNKDYLMHLENEIKRENGYIQDCKKEIEESEKKLQKEPNNEEAKNIIADRKDDISYKENILKVLQYRYDNKIPFDSTNWRSETLEDIVKCSDTLRTKLMDEKQFNQEKTLPNSTMKMNYEEYKQQFVKNNAEAEGNINKNWYSLKKNMPQLNDIKDARSVVNGLYEIYIILAVIIIIIIGGGIVANEFSKGTIRLLAIRPVSRGKILLSKLLALLIIGYGIILSSLVLLVISSGFVYGFDTLKTPVLEVVNNNVLEVGYFNYMLPKLFMSSTSLVFITSLVFMISTIAKNTALAVAASTVLYLGTLPVLMMFMNDKTAWITDTLFMYINQSMFNVSPIFSEMLKVNLGITLNPVVGSVQLLIASLIMIIISFAVFIKKDIKN